MESLKLGRTDAVVSRIALGCWAIGGHGWGQVDDRESRDAIRAAFETGVTLFDTADVYGFGHSETLLSEALGDDARKVVIATKFGVRWDDSGKITRDVSPAYARQAVAASLKRLKLDCIPLYQIHWPDGTTPVADTMGELERLRDEGKIRWIGVSNFSGAQIREAQDAGRVEASQFEYSLVSREAEANELDACLSHNMAGLTYGSLAKGLLSGKFAPDARFDRTDTRSRDRNFQGERFARNLRLTERLSEVGTFYGKSAGQVAIRWLLERPGVSCAIVGARNRRQVVENAGACDWRLSEEHVALLSQLSRHPEV